MYRVVPPQCSGQCRLLVSGLSPPLPDPYHTVWAQYTKVGYSPREESVPYVITQGMYRIAKSRQITLRAVVDVMGIVVAARPYPIPRQGGKEQLPGVAQELQQRHKLPHQTFHCCFVGDHEVAVYVVGTGLVPFWQGFFTPPVLPPCRRCCRTAAG